MLLGKVLRGMTVERRRILKAALSGGSQDALVAPEPWVKPVVKSDGPLPSRGTRHAAVGYHPRTLGAHAAISYWEHCRFYLIHQPTACVGPNANNRQSKPRASFLFVRRGTQSYDGFIAAVSTSASPEHDDQDNQHVGQFLDWRKLNCVCLVGLHVRDKIPSGKRE